MVTLISYIHTYIYWFNTHFNIFLIFRALNRHCVTLRHWMFPLSQKFMLNHKKYASWYRYKIYKKKNCVVSRVCETERMIACHITESIDFPIGCVSRWWSYCTNASQPAAPRYDARWNCH